jgi:hypothetical protein
LKSIFLKKSHQSFIRLLDNVKEVTLVDTFWGSNGHNNTNINLVYKNCSENSNRLNALYNLTKDASENEKISSF